MRRGLLAGHPYLAPPARLPICTPSESAAQIRARLSEADAAVAQVAVVDRDAVVGLISGGRLRAAAPETEAAALMETSALNSDRAWSAAEESVPARLRHRLPWLVLGLLGAMGSAIFIGSFEGRLEANVLIAFFVPAIVYMADAVGTQTEAVLIRGLAAGVHPREIAARELLTGFVTGIVVGAAFFVFALVGWGDTEVALAVALALCASCSIATVLAMALPSYFQLRGIDPAFGSGPLATVIQDLLSIAVYFGIVVLIVF